MKNVLFLTSHLFSGAERLMSVLDHNPSIVMTHTGSIYDHPDALLPLFSTPHPRRTSGAIYGDLLLYNLCLSNSVFYDLCKFIYVIRPGSDTINLMVENSQYSENNALAYYTFRLERICEMAKRTPKAIAITWESLRSQRAFPVIEEYLGLSEPLPRLTIFEDAPKDLVHFNTIEKAQDCYERHLYYLKHQKITLIQ